MKIFGHPVHVMLIHFPSALFPMDLVCSIIAYAYGLNSFAHASFYAMAGGVVLGGMAMLAGGADLLTVSKDKPQLVVKILIHGSINTAVVIGYSIIAFMAYKNYPALLPDSLLIMALKGALVALMVVGNYFGGNLVLKEKIGVD
ncbi:DUF2231 domain-containing protein [Chryseolinea soli]|uniref:DUF2231 domain-containing protein n=1 Tax=Chryseolinea soli TaxID=2321403 RepID=A0A385SMY7_9BACT|nr:DUF2231 domain-containing protein [Chryseolinea soli]AYB32212.1 DUF2231 domain-containing protein [Chryseolinea soli]